MLVTLDECCRFPSLLHRWTSEGLFLKACYIKVESPKGPCADTKIFPFKLGFSKGSPMCVLVNMSRSCLINSKILWPKRAHLGFRV